MYRTWTLFYFSKPKCSIHHCNEVSFCTIKSVHEDCSHLNQRPQYLPHSKQCECQYVQHLGILLWANHHGSEHALEANNAKYEQKDNRVWSVTQPECINLDQPAKLLQYRCSRTATKWANFFLLRMRLVYSWKSEKKKQQNLNFFYTIFFCCIDAHPKYFILDQSVTGTTSYCNGKQQQNEQSFFYLGCGYSWKKKRI